jgi:hypothetical protein
MIITEQQHTAHKREGGMKFILMSCPFSLCIHAYVEHSHSFTHTPGPKRIVEANHKFFKLRKLIDSTFSTYALLSDVNYVSDYTR